jgi:hypothetical protein
MQVLELVKYYILELIRTESSALKDHLYKKNMEANPYCSCKLTGTCFIQKIYA